MFGQNSARRDDARHLLGGENIADDEEVWEQNSVRSERNTAGISEIWEQDPLSGESHELQQISTPDSQAASSQAQFDRSRRTTAIPEDLGEAGTNLEAEFERIFNPVRPRIRQVRTWRP